MNKILKVSSLLIGVIWLSGCSSGNDLEAMRIEPTSYLRIESEADEPTAPLNYVIVPDVSVVSILDKFEDEYVAYDLEEFEVTEDTVTFTYDGQTVELTDIKNQQYEDPDGNIYEMSFISDDETE